MIKNVTFFDAAFDHYARSTRVLTICHTSRHISVFHHSVTMPPTKDIIYQHFSNPVNGKVRCKYCQIERRDVPRDMRTHITAKCSIVPDDVKTVFVARTPGSTRRNTPVSSPLPMSPLLLSPVPTIEGVPTPRKRQRTIAECAGVGSRIDNNTCNVLLGRMVAGCGLPLSVVDHPLFIEFVRGTTGKLSNCYEHLSLTLLFQ